MLESLSYSVSGALPDRSRYSVRHSASKWTPDPQDLRLDDAISSFAKLGFLPSSPFNDVHQTQHFSDYDHHQPPHQPRYAGSYAGDIEPEDEYADSTSRRDAYRDTLRAIEYPSSTNGKDRKSRASSHYQHSQHRGNPPTSSTYYQTPPPPRRYDHQRALVPYNPAHTQQYDDLEPSDSISQISASASATRKHRYTYVPREERRGRTRRREDGYGAPTVLSGTTVRSHGGGRSRVETGTGGMGYQTRVISPFDWWMDRCDGGEVRCSW